MFLLRRAEYGESWANWRHSWYAKTLNQASLYFEKRSSMKSVSIFFCVAVIINGALLNSTILGQNLKTQSGETTPTQEPENSASRSTAEAQSASQQSDQAVVNEEEKRVEAAKASILKSKRIVFLGDSNTHASEYVVQLEAAFLDTLNWSPEIINLGLPSETCCGLSEPIHPFPRPNVQERLDRVLAKTKPDLVVACYGMNDGIYHPFDKTRFEAYQLGIRTIIKKVNATGAKLILLTPPPFDPIPGRAKGKLVAADAKEFSWKTIYENYDSEVMKPYATWVMEQQPHVLAVVDTHGPVANYLKKKRKSDPKFTFSNDGVHFDKSGHQLFAQTILDSLSASCGLEAKLSQNEKLLELVRRRQAISHLTWLSEVKHLRPGVKAGLPLKEAKEKITPISEEIKAMLGK